MSVSDFVRNEIIERLEKRSIVVWYDGERAFEEFVQSFQADSCVVVSAVESTLRSRRQAEEVYRQMYESDAPAKAQATLLIYVPRYRRATMEERERDPFEVFALAGIAFGDKEAEQLQSLARQAMPNRADEVTRLFAQGNPSLSMLDRLEATQRWPLLREALGTESVSEAIALVLCKDETIQGIDSIQGCREEFLRLLESEIGLPPLDSSKSWTELQEQLGKYVLFSEFALDLPSALPESLSAVPKADTAYQAAIFSACDRMRTSSDLREGYVQLAEQVEAQLQLPTFMENAAELGSRDTFPFEERRYLRRVLEFAEQGNLVAALTILDQRRHSVWKNRLDRANVWMVADRCVTFLKTAERVSSAWKSKSATLYKMVSAYAPSDGWGWAELDRNQRLFEQSATACTGEGDEIESLVDLCRRRYRDVALGIQERFLSHVQQQGWPPEGVLRQTQIFDQYVAPLLEQRSNKVAFFLADSLRFEMGRDLAEALSQVGEVETLAVCSVLPTTTPCGMAALMPNADGTLRLVESNEEIIPVLGERQLKESKDRMRLLKERYGDRFKDLEPEDFLNKKVDTLRKQLASVDLLVVRTKDPDQIAESLGNWKARKYISDVIGEMADAVRRLSLIGFTHFVISADHGHVLIDEIPPGEKVEKPNGKWLKTKRRSLLGESLSGGAGLVILKAEQVGIQGDVKEICVPTGFKVFRQVEGYFHEGISLQEAIVPLVIVRAKGNVSSKGKQEISLQYRSDRFTNRVISLKVQYQYLLQEPIRVRIEAYDDSSSKAKQVGEAADCEARDERTNEVILQPNQEIQVPVLIDPDFSGSKVEIRVIDPQTGVIWAKLELKNAALQH